MQDSKAELAEDRAKEGEASFGSLASGLHAARKGQQVWGIKDSIPQKMAILPSMMDQRPMSTKFQVMSGLVRSPRRR